MIVAIPFRCVRTHSVMVRGVVFCPQLQSAHLLARLNADGQTALDDRAVDDAGTGRHWVQQHFDFASAPPARVEPAPFAFKRCFAFARFGDLAIERNRCRIGFDVFVGPGDCSLLHDRHKGQGSRRAINGFADVIHYPVFDREVACGEECAVTGHAALCLVETADDLLGERWRLRSNRIRKVVAQNEVRSMLLIEALAPWRQRAAELQANAVARHGVGHPLERGFLFRARLVVKLPEVRDRTIVGARLRDSVK